MYQLGGNVKNVLNYIKKDDIVIPLVLSMWIVTRNQSQLPGSGTMLQYNCDPSRDRVPEPVDQGLGQLALAVGHDSDRSRDIVPEPGSLLWNWLRPSCFRGHKKGGILQ